MGVDMRQYSALSPGMSLLQNVECYAKASIKVL